HVLQHGLVVLAAHEAGQRRQRARREHVEVGQLTRCQRQRFEHLEVVRTVARAVDQLAAVRCDQLRLGGDAHAATAAGSNPCSSSSSKIRCALSPGSSCSDSIRISGDSGASYGSDTPVNSLISPLNAFSYRPFTSRRAHTPPHAPTETPLKAPLPPPTPPAPCRRPPDGPGAGAGPPPPGPAPTGTPP